MTKNIDSREFNLDLRTLTPGTRFFEASYTTKFPNPRKTEKFVDNNGVEWYRKDAPKRKYTIKEYEFLGASLSFITIAADAPEHLVDDITSCYEDDVYIRDVNTDELLPGAFYSRSYASTDLEELQKAVDEANKDHS